MKDNELHEFCILTLSICLKKKTIEHLLTLLSYSHTAQHQKTLKQFRKKPSWRGKTTFLW